MPTTRTTTTQARTSGAQDLEGDGTFMDRQRQLQRDRQRRTNDIALHLLTQGHGYRVAWSEDGDAESGPAGGTEVEYRLGQLRLITASGGTAYLTVAPGGKADGYPLCWLRVTDPDVARILHGRKRDTRLPLQAGYHDGELVTAGGHALPRPVDEDALCPRRCSHGCPECEA